MPPLPEITWIDDASLPDRLLRLGVQRVREPSGGLPQAAQRLDNDADRLYATELRIAVERLNIDSASFVQMERDGGADPRQAVRTAVERTVAARGKQHNPVTGSGGMLLGTIVAAGARAGLAQAGLAIGDRVATLVSLSLTPLRLHEILDLDLERHQVSVRADAILFDAAGCAKLPEDLPERVALSALDVAGAAPQVSRLVRPGARVLILGCGGKSGLLCSAAARQAGASVVVGVERSAAAAAPAQRLGACTAIVVADAADALAVADRAIAAGDGQPFDFTVSCVNVPNAEMGAILATRDGGTIYFFSMATSFTQAALGAEGVLRDVHMLVGNGYCPGHAQATLGLLRSDERLRELFVERYG